MTSFPTGSPPIPLPKGGKWRVWWLAARPATLTAAVAPVVAGTAIAAHSGAHRPLAAGLALLTALALQVGVNYANDYSDFVRGADNPQRIGPLRAASSGVIPPSQVKLAAFLWFALAALSGLILSLTTDWRLLLAGGAAVLAGWLYTGGPRPYGYLGLGELFVFIFFGWLATVGTTYVQLLTVPPATWLIGSSLGLLASAVLTLNNLRDLDTDAAAGKRTLAVRLGARGSWWLLLGEMLIALLLPVLAVAFAQAPPLAVLPLALAPFLIQILRMAAKNEPRRLISGLHRMALIELWFALLWALGMIL